MTNAARHALAVIRKCIDSDLFNLSVHFRERMDKRGLFWPDVVAVIEDPTSVQYGGDDRYGRSKWLISGECATASNIEIVCAVEVDETGTELITLYWES